MLLDLLPPPLPPPPPAPVEPWYETGVVDLTLAAYPLPPPPLAGPEETEVAALGDRPPGGVRVDEVEGPGD